MNIHEYYDLSLPFDQQPGMKDGKGRANCLGAPPPTNIQASTKPKPIAVRSINDLVRAWAGQGIAMNQGIMVLGLRSKPDVALIPVFFKDRETATTAFENLPIMPFDIMVASYDLTMNLETQLLGNFCNTLLHPPIPNVAKKS